MQYAHQIVEASGKIILAARNGFPSGISRQGCIARSPPAPPRRLSEQKVLGDLPRNENTLLSTSAPVSSARTVLDSPP